MRFRLLGAAALLALVSACHSGASSSAASSGPSCLQASPPPGVPSSAPDRTISPGELVGSAGTPGSAASGLPSGAGGVPVPGVALDCFSGAGKARLTDLRAPAIVTLWASWCVPCAEEMPAFQAVADKGRVRVIGVVTFDQHDHAQGFIEDHKVSFPMLNDPDKRLLIAVGRNALPVTLFVTADGRIAHLYNDTALNQTTLESLTARYLGVTT